MARQILLTQEADKARDEAGVEFVLDDGQAPIVLDPPLLWSDEKREAITAVFESEDASDDDLARATFGEEACDRFVAAGFTLNFVLRTYYRQVGDLGESSAS